MPNIDYQSLSEQLITHLQQGTAPWQTPWVYKLPFNAESQKRYRSVNLLILMLQPYEDPRWATFKQAQKRGWQVREGEKGTRISRLMFKENESTGKKDCHFSPATVFNAEQMDGVPPLSFSTNPRWAEASHVEQLTRQTGARINHRKGDRAFYQSSTDRITLPLRSQFSSQQGYYATLLHELAHWTGHPKRLNRDLGHPFGSPAYAREELRAEIASMILGHELDVPERPENHLSYLDSWIRVLRDDPKEIQRAARAAEDIADYLQASLADAPQAA